MNTTQRNRVGSLFPAGLGEVDSLFEHFFRPHGSPPQAGWRTPASVWEAEDGYHIELDLPGVSQDDVELTADQGQLTIAARRAVPEEERAHWQNERGFGEAQRAFTLPESADFEAIQAELNQGVLHVTIGKRPEAQPRRIEVKTG